MKHGKNYRESATLRDRTTAYTLGEAVAIIRNMSKVKFDETVEISAKLGVDPRHADQMIRGTVVLPHGTGRKVRVLALVKGEHADAAREAGADMVCDDEYLEKIKVPPEFDFTAVYGLSNELREKLLLIKPISLGQASRIPGITPAAISIIMIYLKKGSSLQ